MKRILLATAFLLAAGTAWAGPQYLDDTGFAVSGYDVVSYFDLEQSDIGTPQPSAVAGRKDLVAEYNGSKFAFSSQENLEKFTANPAAYAPQYDGHCAYGVSRGGKVPGNPHLWRIVDGKLFLNITKNVVGFWEEDIPGNITLAQENWTGIEPTAASTNTIPSFTSPAPTAN